jgi:hypothetical protein
MRFLCLSLVGVLMLLIFAFGAFGWVQGADLQGNNVSDWEVNVSAKDIEGVYMVSLIWKANGLPYGTKDESLMVGEATPKCVVIQKGNVISLGFGRYDMDAVTKRVDMPVLVDPKAGKTLYLCGVIQRSDETELPFVVLWDKEVLHSEFYVGEDAYKSFIELMGTEQLKEAS